MNNARVRVKLYLREIARENVDQRSGASYYADVEVLMNLVSDESDPRYYRVGLMRFDDRTWSAIKWRSGEDLLVTVL